MNFSQTDPKYLKKVMFDSVQTFWDWYILGFCTIKPEGYPHRPSDALQMIIEHYIRHRSYFELAFTDGGFDKYLLHLREARLALPNHSEVRDCLLNAMSVLTADE